MNSEHTDNGPSTQPVLDLSSTPREMPPTHAGWVVVAITFFWPLAFAAANHSSRVVPLWFSGHHAEAQQASARAKRLGINSILAFIVAAGLLTIAYFALLIAVIASIGP